MNILFYSDPHFGLSRREHVTEASLKAREAYALEYLQELTRQYDAAICLGDLFDKSNNKEEVILRVANVLGNTDYILAGNHDIINREGAVSSLHLLSEIHKGKVIFDMSYTLIGGVLLVFVPHCKTQTEFEQELEKAKSVVSSYAGRPAFLLLHCNYDSDFADKEHELNLPEKLAKDLLSVFSYILIGHEHAANSHLEGRVKMVSSLFTTSFSDFEAKHRALCYNTETGDFTDVTAHNKSYSGLASEFLSSSKSSKSVIDHPDCAYISLEDDLPPGGASKLVVDLFARGAFAVRLRKPASPEQVVREQTEYKPVSLPDMISTRLRDEDEAILQLWQEYLKTTDVMDFR